MRSSGVYGLYGLCIQSRWPLPGSKIPECRTASIRISEGPEELFAAARREAPPQNGNVGHAGLKNGSTYLKWPDLFEFLISAEGRKIVGHPLSGASAEAFRTYLLGQVLSFALINQGIEPLHSTAIVIGQVAIGLCGDCGYGKSSLACSFLQSGHKLLTDDLLVLKRRNGHFLAQPGPARLKLYPETAKTLFGESVPGTPMNNLGPKLIFPLTRHQSSSSATPLKALYVLDPPTTPSRDQRIAIRPLPQRQAFLELTANTFNSVVTHPDRLKNQFAFASQVAAGVPVRRLSYPRRLDALPSVREAILSDLSKL